MKRTTTILLAGCFGLGLTGPAMGAQSAGQRVRAPIRAPIKVPTSSSKRWLPTTRPGARTTIRSAPGVRATWRRPRAGPMLHSRQLSGAASLSSAFFNA